jgi:tetratricopeptide (TPR) repeat protein
MIASSRAWLCGGLGLFGVACSDPQNHSNVPDEPSGTNGAPVIVLGGPTPKAPRSNEPIMVAGDEPAVVAKAAPIATTPDGDLAAVILDSRKIRWSPRPTQLLVTEIQMLEALIARTPPGVPDRAQLLRRLGDNYVELKNGARRDKERALSLSASSSAARAQAGNDIAKFDKIIGAARTMALKNDQELVNTFPNFCQAPNPTDPALSQGCNDEVYYAMGLENQEIGKFDESRKHYFMLIKSFPQSKLISNAYLAFGEFFFSEAATDPSKLAFAQQVYEKVLQTPPPQNETYGFACYRLAQVFHEKHEEPNALANFVKAIDFSISYSSIRGSGPLGESARREIVPSYAVAGTPRKAEAFFKRLTMDPAGTNVQLVGMLDALVRVYLHDNKRVEATDVCYAFSGGSGSIAACQAIAPSALQPIP